MKIYLQVLTSSIKPQIWFFYVVVLLMTANKWTKMKNARAGRAKLLFIQFFFFHIKNAYLRRSRCRRSCRCYSFLTICKSYDVMQRKLKKDCDLDGS